MEPHPSTDAADDVIETVDDPEHGRYEIAVNGQLAGVAEYELRDGTIVITHTEVGHAFAGRGLGSRLVGDVLDDARRRGLWVDPVCSFTAHFIRSHPAYQDLLATRAE